MWLADIIKKLKKSLLVKATPNKVAKNACTAIACITTSFLLYKNVLGFDSTNIWIRVAAALLMLNGYYVIIWISLQLSYIKVNGLMDIVFAAMALVGFVLLGGNKANSPWVQVIFIAEIFLDIKLLLNGIVKISISSYQVIKSKTENKEDQSIAIISLIVAVIAAVLNILLVVI